mmetsp:Transcript_685/g.2802  ORF Transcript_685/g.2802 Transcript_685/m.2802 type:complete len:223 (-) Transcript_685:568-1236(-)
MGARILPFSNPSQSTPENHASRLIAGIVDCIARVPPPPMMNPNTRPGASPSARNNRGGPPNPRTPNLFDGSRAMNPRRPTTSTKSAVTLFEYLTSPAAMARYSAWTLLARNGGLPCVISNANTPSAHQSTARASYPTRDVGERSSLPAAGSITSGARYSGVPTAVYDRPARRGFEPASSFEPLTDRRRAHEPRSHSLGYPLSSSSTFSGLISLCATPTTAWR